jgi:hypothetical protein
MSKSTWCQVEYENYLIDRLGYNPFTNKKYYKCKYGKDCFGSHGLKEMVLCKEAKSFNKLDYSELNLLEFFNIMLNLIKNNRNIVVNKHKELIEKTNLDDFISVLNLWYKFAFYYGKLLKDFKKNQDIKTKYKKISEIPIFYFDNDYIMWILRRGLFQCDKHRNLLKQLNKKKKISVFDICVGYEACKFGYHHVNNSFCKEDLIKGTCDCANKNIKNDLKKITTKIQNKMSDSTRETKELIELKKELTRLKNIEINTKRHLTYEGLICYEKQKNKKEEVKKTVKKKVARVCLVTR